MLIMVRPERGAGIFNEGGWQLVHRLLQSFVAVFGRIVNTERVKYGKGQVFQYHIFDLFSLC